MANIFDTIDFSNDNPEDILDLDSMIEDAAKDKDVSVDPPVTPEPPTPDTSKETDAEADILELPDDGFEADVKKTEAQEEPGVSPTKETDTSTSEQPSESPYSSLAKVLHEGGVISDLEGFDKIEAGHLDEFIDKVREKVTDGVTSEMTDEQKEYYEALKSGIPTEYFHKQKSTIEQLNGITDEVLEADTDQSKTLRYNLMYNDFISKGHDADSAKELTLDLFKLGKDKTRAKQSLTNYKEVLQKDLDDKKAEGLAQQEKEKEAELQRIEDLKNKVYEVKEFFPGYKVTKSTQDKVYKAISNVVSYDKEGRPVNTILKAIQDNPEELWPKIGYLWAMTDGFTSMKNLNSKASSKVAKEVEDMIVNGTLTGNSESAEQQRQSTVSSRSMVSSLKQLGIGEQNTGF